MTRFVPGWARRHSPGPRGAVVAIAAVLVLVLALAVAETVAGHVTQTAVDEAVLSVETIVRGDVDELLTASAMSHASPSVARAINTRLERLTADNLLRIKIWSPDGTVLFSDLPALRGRTFEISDELDEALEGEVETELTAPDASENVFERGLASRVLEVYLPLRDPATGAIIGAYEVYHNAATHRRPRRGHPPRRAAHRRHLRRRPAAAAVPGLLRHGPPACHPEPAAAGADPRPGAAGGWTFAAARSGSGPWSTTRRTSSRCWTPTAP